MENEHNLNWDIAQQIVNKLNQVDDEEDLQSNSAKWSFDCGFKLDFDGGLIIVSSRFYPEKVNETIQWSGNLYIRNCFANLLIQKEIKSESLTDLKVQVDKIIKDCVEKINKALI